MNLISKIKTIWKNRKKIWYGFYFKYIKTSKWVEEIANARMSVCKACPHIDLKGDTCLVPNTQPCCGKCGCSLELKVYSLSSDCGDEENPRWKAILTEEQEASFNKNIDA